MTSIRAKVIIRAIKRGGLLNTEINSENLEGKRSEFKKVNKYFPKPRWAKVKEVHGIGFKGEWIITPESRKTKILLYVHGGGFVFDLTVLYRDLIARLARAGKVTVFALNYSLAPEHPFPAALHEAAASYRWLLEEGYRPQDIILAGDSAGGTLVLSLLQHLKVNKLPLPAGAVVMSPPTDAKVEGKTVVTNRDKDVYILPETLKYFTDMYSGETRRDHPIGSPLYGDWNGMPPLLIHIDKNEILYDDSVRLADKAKKAGVDVHLQASEGLFHVWHIFARYMPEARKSIKQIGLFIQQRLKD